MPTTAGYGAVSIRLTHSGMVRPAYCTFGIHPTGTDPATMASSCMTAWLLSVNTVMDSEVTADQCTVRYGIDGAEDVIGTSSNTVTGVVTQASPSAQVAALVRKNTARGGRRGKGRMYIPWMISETNVDEMGTIASGSMSTYQAALTGLITQLDTGNVPMVVLHRPSKPGITHPTTPGAPNLVTSLILQSLIATQRRRLGR